MDLQRLTTICCFLLIHFIYGVFSQQWMKLALASSDIYNPDICHKYKFWTNTQRKLCLDYNELIPVIGNGAGLAYFECKHQFRWRRWNCTANENQQLSLWSFDGKSYPSLFGNNFALDSREASFVNALFSAAVAHAVTKACSSNRLSSCSCQRNTNTDTNTNYRNDDADDGTTDNGFRWDRCSDNVEFGVNFAKQFIDSVELNWSVERMYTSYSKSLMNLHNNEVGRKVVRESMRHRCGCHGVSGSCATRICSQELLAFRFIGAALRRKYEAAVQVKMKYISTHHLLVPYKKETSSLTHIELVYLQQSPSYCNLVSGRRCKNKKASKGSCAVMCCGRGHRIKERTFLKNCRCKFIWCCKVTCQKCIHKQKIFTCK